MPELPEIETYVRELEPRLRGKQILRAANTWPRTIAHPEAPIFLEQIRGQRFTTFGRRGKYMLLGLESGGTLIVHLGMTGELRLRLAEREPDRHTHVVFDLDSGERLHYRDPRKFGRMWLVEDPQRVLGKLGPEPLGAAFRPQQFQERLAKRQASIKTLLLNQGILAGVGNIYADEALFRAGIDPRRAGGSLTAEEVERLHGAVRSVLQEGIAMRGSSLQDYVPPSGERGAFQEVHRVFRRTGEPCFTCGTPIQRIVLGQRSTHFCPRCQR